MSQHKKTNGKELIQVKLVTYGDNIYVHGAGIDITPVGVKPKKEEHIVATRDEVEALMLDTNNAKLLKEIKDKQKER